MFCYNCGNDCKEDRFCFNCGCRVGKPEDRMKIYPDPPLGVYSTENGYLEFCADYVCRWWYKSFRGGNFEHKIYYSNISDVWLSPYNSVKGYYLSIREKGGIRPISHAKSDLILDAETSYFTFLEQTTAEKIYEFLARCADINKQHNKTE